MEPITISEESTVNDILRAIDTWAINRGGEEAKDLWAILSAMRGPDDSDDNIKFTSTCRIRGFALPHLAGIAGAIVRDTLYHEGMRELIAFNESNSHHFNNHVRQAAIAIRKYSILPIESPTY